MDGALEGNGMPSGATCILGFNPCSRGWCARRRENTGVKEGEVVSILVLVDGALEVNMINFFVGFPHVSILVLVDGALEAP